VLSEGWEEKDLLYLRAEWGVGRER